LAEPQLFEDIKLYDPAPFSALDTKKPVTTPNGNPLVFTLSDKRINAAAAQFEQVRTFRFETAKGERKEQEEGMKRQERTGKVQNNRKSTYDRANLRLKAPIPAGIHAVKSQFATLYYPPLLLTFF